MEREERSGNEVAFTLPSRTKNVATTIESRSSPPSKLMNITDW